ncbi:MAG: RAD55 family ATPase [Haloarculaceae archaeon]
MVDISVPDEGPVDTTVRYLPFGVPGLDGHVRGIPSGSAVLLAGAPDAGGRAFLYTSLASLAQAKHDPDRYRRRIDGAIRDAIPERVSYVTLTQTREHVYADLEAVLDDEQYGTLADHLTVADFSQRFLAASPVPDALFDQRRDHAPIEIENAGEAIEDVLEAISEHVASVGDGAVVVIDDLADLMRARHFGLGRDAVIGFLLGLREAVVGWNTLAYVVYDRRAGAVRDDLDVSGLLDGSVYFYSNDQGHATYRTLRVGSFGGALDTERQTVFESSVGPAGMRAKATRKIAPSNW